ncbi:MAG: hypothetical protein HY402_02025 [Elusimicrobia bacterium]|nr:hypothetical protein [Elusimicrobiota bacterium]
MSRILVAIPQESWRQDLALLLESLGHEVSSVQARPEMLEHLKGEFPELLFMADGIEETPAESLLREIQVASPLTTVVVCLKSRDATRAVEVLKAGAFECVAPPWTCEGLDVVIRKAVRWSGTALSLAEASRRERVRIWLRFPRVLICAAVLALLISAGLIGRRAYFPAQPPEAPHWALPYRHPAGLAWDGKVLWVADWFSQAVYLGELHPGFSVKKTYHFPTWVPVTLAFVEGTLWSASASGKIQKHLLDGSLTVVESYPAVGPATTGLCYDGLYLWSAEASAPLITKHLLDSKLSVVERYPYPGGKPAGLVYDGKNLWSLDAVSGQLLEHDISQPDRVLGRWPLEIYQTGQWKAAGLAWDGRFFWSVAEPLEESERSQETARIFRHGVLREG